MKNRFFGWLAVCLVLLLGAGAAVSAAGDNSDRTGFTEADAEYYMEDSVYGFFRPGVDFHLVSVEIPDDLQPVVTFMLTDPAGAPLDITGVLTPGPTTMYFMLSYVPQGEEEVVSYCPGSAFCYDRGGTLTTQDVGSYTYKFSTVLPDDYDVDAAHTLSSVARRQFNAEEFEFTGLEANYIDNDVYNFIPSSGETTTTRDVVTTETCNNCHNPLGEHGGSRFQEVRICLHCHNEDNLGEYALGPMIHRIHASNEPEIGEVHYPTDLNDCQVCHTGGTPTADMPLVANPNPITVCNGDKTGMTELDWIADGPVEIRVNSATGNLFAKTAGSGSKETGNWVNQGKKFFLVDSVTGETLDTQEVDTTVFGCATNAPYTYSGGIGAMHTNWMTRPSRDACGGCHANIDWVTGEGHVGGPAENDDFCSFCHQADSGVEFDRSVRGAHTPILASDKMLGVQVTIKQVTNTGPGQSPTVRFSLANKNGLIDPATLETFTMTLTGPNDDFDVNIRENAIGKLVPAGNDWTYTFTNRVPMDAEGSFSVGYEGRITRDVNGDGSTERDSAENAIVAVAVTDDEPMPRRMIVDDAKCESCHSNLSLHGDNRKNATDYCQTCHMPEATDAVVRLEGEPESIHFKYMIHKIHRGAELENLPYIVYGFRSSVHDYSEVHYPGDLRDCEVCHVEGTYGIPLPEGALPTYNPAAQITEMDPITATCLSCHDGDAAASHALANTSELGESCEACHGDGKTYSVDRVHAR